MNEVLKAIMDRRSIRAYTPEPLTERELSALVDAALASPTARNCQYWHFSVVQEQGVLDEINADLTKLVEARLPEGKRGRFNEKGFHVFYHAPTVFVISAPVESDNAFAQIDAGIAAENLAIAAQGLGLGSVILGMPKEVFLSPREAYYNARLDIPAGYRFAIAVAVGHAAASKDAHPIGEGKVSFIR